MAVSETDSSDGNSDSSFDNTKHLERKERMFTKVIVRRLPPTMNKDSFLSDVSPLPDYDYIYFVKADMSLGEFAFARAYINFKNPSDIFIFKEKFDNYVFLDSKGNEYAAVVEFAPFSRIPRKRNKVRTDLKCGTIETDPVYLDFLESLKEDPNEGESKMEYNIQPTPDEDKKVVNTPLLDYIKQRRIDRQKMKEEKREERKRRELERKRVKEEERRKKRTDHLPRSPHGIKSGTETTKSIQILPKETETVDETIKVDSDKSRDRKSDKYSYKTSKSQLKDYERRPIKADREFRRSVDDRKPLSRSRQRPYHDKYESTSTEYRSKRETMLLKSKKSTEPQKEEEKIEKKVKKFSERREERRNEIKKQESMKLERENSKEDDKTEPTKSDTASKPQTQEDDKKESKSDCSEKSEVRESRKENDPRTQRRIRNKDRPTMALYQPGMLRNRKTDSSESDQKNSVEKDDVECPQ